MMLGSDVKEDACRECGGDGSNCNTVSGLFDTDDLQAGKWKYLFHFFFGGQLWMIVLNNTSRLAVDEIWFKLRVSVNDNLYWNKISIKLLFNVIKL